MSTGGRSWFGWPASGRPREPNKEEFEKVRIPYPFHDRICGTCGQAGGSGGVWLHAIRERWLASSLHTSHAVASCLKQLLTPWSHA